MQYRIRLADQRNSITPYFLSLLYSQILRPDMSAIAAVEAEEISENMEAPSCWICFEEQGDDEQPLVRDCSCRGGSGVCI